MVRQLIEEFQVHDVLNPKLWDKNKLRPEVKNKILEIVTAFEDYIQVPIEIVDVQLVGSNASYNYTDKSDLDVHVIANFEIHGISPTILQLLYDAKKSQFNKNLDISIHGVQIEMYVQDVKSNTVSNGIYSICDDNWIKEPTPITEFSKKDNSKELSKWESVINDACKRQSYQEIVNLTNNLYLMRKNSIAVDGEYGEGNQLFKDIRNKGLLQKLKDNLDKALSKKLTLEGLSSGQIVSRYDD